jgi:hypothetical protein
VILVAWLLGLHYIGEKRREEKRREEKRREETRLD